MRKEVETLFRLVLVGRGKKEREGGEGIQVLGSLFSLSLGMQVRVRRLFRSFQVGVKEPENTGGRGTRYTCHSFERPQTSCRSHSAALQVSYTRARE